MGLLDDLKQQAEQQQGTSGDPTPLTGSDDFYAEHIKHRLLAAYNFFTELVNQLNAMKLNTRADYPLKPDGKPVTLMQQGYKVYSDSIPEPRQITLSFHCALANPTTYEVQGWGPAQAQCELLDRYMFKYDKREQRDQKQTIVGARFQLQGPLAIKFVLQFDAQRQVIKLLIANFAGPATSQYNLKPEQLDEAFLDHLGNYILRKEQTLFKEEISDDVKAMLRKKLQDEQQQREAELQAAEQLRKAEEEQRRQNSATGQLKTAVSQKMTENTEKLKKAVHDQVNEQKEKLMGMFNRLKKQAGFDALPDQISEQTSVPPATTFPVTRGNPVSPQVTIHQSVRPVGKPAAQNVPTSANRQAVPGTSARMTTESPPRKATGTTQTNASQAPPTEQSDVPLVKHKQPAPPRVYQGSASNPFLKPEDFAPVPKSSDEGSEKGSEEQTAAPDGTVKPKAQTHAGTVKPATAKTSTPKLSPGPGPARPVAEPTMSAVKPSHASMQPKAPAAQSGSGLSLEPIASDTEPLSLPAVTEPSSEISSLSLEDELERDLARLMENDQQPPPVESATSDTAVSASDTLDFDLSSPDALEIHLEDTDEISARNNTQLKK